MFGGVIVGLPGKIVKSVKLPIFMCSAIDLLKALVKT
jgi:hypothetical protein